MTRDRGLEAAVILYWVLAEAIINSQRWLAFKWHDEVRIPKVTGPTPSPTLQLL
jgi:hypothetical protein